MRFWNMFCSLYMFLLIKLSKKTKSQSTIQYLNTEKVNISQVWPSLKRFESNLRSPYEVTAVQTVGCSNCWILMSWWGLLCWTGFKSSRPSEQWRRERREREREIKDSLYGGENSLTPRKVKGQGSQLFTPDRGGAGTAATERCVCVCV